MAKSQAKRQLVELDPYDINVSEYNERTEDLLLGHLEESVRQQGVIQPVIVRQRDMTADVPYEVVIGQRRVMAAQGADIDSVPAVVVDWNDAEALEKSISENIETFREKVGEKDRAKAINRLKELNDWKYTDVAESLGVDKSTVSKWLEWTRDEWDGTSVHADSTQNESFVNETSDQTPDVETVQQVRQMTGGGDEGEEILEEATDSGLKQEDVREAKKRTDRGEEPKEAIQQVAEEKRERQSGTIKVRSEVTFTGSKAEAVQRIAEDRGTTENRIVEQAVETFLDAEGYL